MYILKDATVYLGENLFGKASKATAPDIDMEQIAIKAMGGIGEFNLNGGVKAMTSSVTITGFDKDVFAKIADPYSEISFMILGSIKKYENETLVDELPAKLAIRGSSQKFSLLGELEAQENIEYPIDFNVSAATLTVNGKQLYDIDMINNIWIVNGVDRLAKTKRNLGLS